MKKVHVVSNSKASNQKKSDVEMIRERLAAVMADKDLFKQTLIASGVYDKNLKLTAAYR